MKKKLMAKSKFATNEETTHVFQKKSAKRKLEDEEEKREDKKARKGDVKKICCHLVKRKMIDKEKNAG